MQRIGTTLIGLSLVVAALAAHLAHAQTKLSWKNNNTTQTQVVVQRATSTSGPWTTIATLGGTVAAYTDNNTAGGTTYYYRVQASKSGWTSNYSNLAGKAIAAVPASNGTGAKGSYYKDQALSTIVSTRTDPQINFAWGSASPMTSVPAGSFSVRWTGSVQTQEGGLYWFQTEAGDGARLWINGTQLVNNWTSAGTSFASIVLAPNTKYSLKMEYLAKSSNAYARLKWTRPGGASAVLIPKTQLFPQ